MTEQILRMAHKNHKMTDYYSKMTDENHKMIDENKKWLSTVANDLIV
jgi:hypothetical protein